VGGLGLLFIAWPRFNGEGAAPFLMTVGAAAAWGIANILSKRAGRVDTLSFVVWSSLVAPIPLLGLSLWFDGPARVVSAVTNLDASTLAAVAYFAYPCTLFAFGAWAYLLSRHTAATVTPFALLVPVTGLAGAALLLGESMAPVEALGGATIAAGLVINVFGAQTMRRFQRIAPAG
jgi:O-acetylserine/cysteine efflux transporter